MPQPCGFCSPPPIAIENWGAIPLTFETLFMEVHTPPTFDFAFFSPKMLNNFCLGNENVLNNLRFIPKLAILMRHCFLHLCEHSSNISGLQRRASEENYAIRRKFGSQKRKEISLRNVVVLLLQDKSPDAGLTISFFSSPQLFLCQNLMTSMTLIEWISVYFALQRRASTFP